MYQSRLFFPLCYHESTFSDAASDRWCLQFADLANKSNLVTLEVIVVVIGAVVVIAVVAVAVVGVIRTRLGSIGFVWVIMTVGIYSHTDKRSACRERWYKQRYKYNFTYCLLYFHSFVNFLFFFSFSFPFFFFFLIFFFKSSRSLYE